MVFRNGEIKYDGSDKLTFDASKQWSMFAAGTYTFTETQNAEIQITNKYTEQTADLDLVKTSVNGTKFDGAEFKLYKKNDNEVYELQKFEYTDDSGKPQTRETIRVINSDESEAELKKSSAWTVLSGRGKGTGSLYVVSRQDLLQTGKRCDYFNR